MPMLLLLVFHHEDHQRPRFTSGQYLELVSLSKVCLGSCCLLGLSSILKVVPKL